MVLKPNKFCMCVFKKVTKNPHLFDNVLIIVESTFPENGFVSSLDFHYCSDLNPNQYSHVKSE